MSSLGGFIGGGGSEPDRMFPTPTSNSHYDLSVLGLTVRNEMSGQAMDGETKDRFGSGLFEERFPAVDLATGTKETGGLRKLGCTDKVNKEMLLHSLALELADLRQISIEMIQLLMDKVYRQDTGLRRTPLPDRMFLPFPASIPRGNTQAKPIPVPQGQINRSINQEPLPEVKTHNGQRDRKFRVIQPGDIDEVPVDQHNGPSVPLLTGITPTPVSRGRGSHAAEESQDGRVRRKCDPCCCSIS